MHLHTLIELLAQATINNWLPQSPPQHVLRNYVERFLPVNKCYPKVLFLCCELMLNLLNSENGMVSVVPLPGLNPNYVSSRLTRFLTFLSSTLSETFITWSSSFIRPPPPHPSPRTSHVQKRLLYLCTRSSSKSFSNLMEYSLLRNCIE